MKRPERNQTFDLGISNTERSFLEMIAANPDEDAPRLVFADWLEEQGDPRAEFIRVQCELARVDKYTERHSALKRRETELFEAHKAEWYGPLGKLVGRVEFRRGVLEHVSAKVAVFLEHAERILQVPTVRSAKLNTLKPVLDDFVRCSQLSRLTHLSLNTCQMGAARAKTLFSCPYLENLTWLDLGNNGLGPGGLEALMGARWPKLRWLGLVRNRLGPRGADLLANWLLLEQLAGLEIEDNDLGDVWAAFEQSPGLKRRVETIATSIQSGNLRELNLKFCLELDEQVACLLAVSPALEHLRDLSLSHVGDRACEALAASAYARRLHELHLRSCRDITGRGIRAILSSPNLAGLKLLDITGVVLGTREARIIVETGLPESLASLVVCSFRFGAERTAALDLLQEHFGSRVKLD